MWAIVVEDAGADGPEIAQVGDVVAGCGLLLAAGSGVGGGVGVNRPGFPAASF
ncbi:hypothetical protein M3C36_17015 [Dietzia cinnamea]|uniref:hypothetical protein n=1 Tax=Dietzia cinnamea TaxID=321318 RepID=UPI0021A72D07|nr:hypothetical protein [Dietzia cinnamea]MCT1886850.1 hypothetical protein [Dietzia cinnamea]